MSEFPSERVLVVPTDLFRQVGYFQGFCREVERDTWPCSSVPQHVSYRPRGEVERDPGFKQLIPYVIFRHRDDRGRETVLQYTRGTGMGEGRLHRKRSVGIGGHISAIDAPGDGGHPYEEGMRRELEEEVAIDTPYTRPLRRPDQRRPDRSRAASTWAWSTVFDVNGRPSARGRRKSSSAAFRPVAEILADMSGFETWSQICMKALFGQSSV